MFEIKECPNNEFLMTNQKDLLGEINNEEEHLLFIEEDFNNSFDNEEDMPVQIINSNFTKFKNIKEFDDNINQKIEFEISLEKNNEENNKEENKKEENIKEENNFELLSESQSSFYIFGKGDTLIQNLPFLNKQPIIKPNIIVNKIDKVKNPQFIINNLFNQRGQNEFHLKIIRNEINLVVSPKKDKNNLFKTIKKKDSSSQKKTTRKKKSDDIRKKIKSRFLKSLKNSINEKLTNDNSPKLFDFLPQCFICDVAKKNNDKTIMNMTFKELMSTDFYGKYNERDKIALKKKRAWEEHNNNNNNNKKKKNKKKNKKKAKELVFPDIKKYMKNKEVIKYLEENKKIFKTINIETIFKMTFKDLFNEYLKSREFEIDIYNLKNEEKDDYDQDYINQYIIIAYEFVNYYSK